MGVVEVLFLVDFDRRGGRSGGLTSAMAAAIATGFSANEVAEAGGGGGGGVSTWMLETISGIGWPACQCRAETGNAGT